ncbi:MAG: YbaB/EbfC family nucleoid-associated protein [bacterium]|nr:YbaB/EbfC family nucleoid-associated protein [bacterium]
MSGSFGEMGNLLKQAQKMQKAMDDARKELAESRVEGTAGGGAVTVIVDGDGQVEAVNITDEALADSNREILEGLVLAAVRDGLAKSARLRDERLAKVTGGLNLPGLM